MVHLESEEKVFPKNKIKQIVETEQKKEKERNSKSNFFGKEDQSFDLEKQARIVAPFKAAGKGNKDGVKTLSKVVKAKSSVKKIIKKKIARTLKKRKVKKISLKDLSFSKDIIKSSKGVTLGKKDGQKNKSGLAQSNDFIEDVPLSDTTNLNTIKYKYYSFYQRIKNKLEQYWGNSLRSKAIILKNKGYRIIANENHITGIIVKMNEKGKIISIVVKNTSGYKELDDAAVESFNKAGPFPNPPEGLIKEGVVLLEWGFVVKT